jgi:hypothetical protein
MSPERARARVLFAVQQQLPPPQLPPLPLQGALSFPLPAEQSPRLSAAWQTMVMPRVTSDSALSTGSNSAAHSTQVSRTLRPTQRMQKLRIVTVWDDSGCEGRIAHAAVSRRPPVFSLHDRIPR